MKEAESMDNIYLRVADESDIDLIFQWANEPMVRKNSFSSRIITYEEHVQWYKKLLNNPCSRQYILICNEQPVGQARITAEGDTAEIGYSICVGQRSHGYGKELLHLITEQAWKDFPEISRVIGKIKPENTASLKAFADAGYTEKYREYEIKKSDRL